MTEERTTTGASRPARAAEPELRLFVAIELPPEWIEALASLQEQLRWPLEDAAGQRLRWVRPEAIHLTLKFLGEVAASRRERIERALATAVATPPGMSLRLGAVGAFSDRRGPRVVWVAIEGETAPLAELAARVEGVLATLGFPREGRPFAPHLTLARVSEGVDAARREAIERAIRSATAPNEPAFRVDCVSLMLSRLGPRGATYERLRAFPSMGPQREDV